MLDNTISIETARNKKGLLMAEKYFNEVYVLELKNYIKSKIIFVFASIPCICKQNALFYYNNVDLVLTTLSDYCLVEYLKEMKTLPSNTKNEFMFKLDEFLNILIIEKMNELEKFMKER